MHPDEPGKAEQKAIKHWDQKSRWRPEQTSQEIPYIYEGEGSESDPRQYAGKQDQDFEPKR